MSDNKIFYFLELVTFVGALSRIHRKHLIIFSIKIIRKLHCVSLLVHSCRKQLNCNILDRFLPNLLIINIRECFSDRVESFVLDFKIIIEY